ncbi:hypothetical protein POTOM_036363 [Populus tomentosa]|uniref:Uncharacterized protein n=1 Tax=Populus tomentosa TaxID=118781 RepID=A0A8X7YYV4_POPTO|nr:hypothetical protein POTOM_036363 [Populus tomentosa]
MHGHCATVLIVAGRSATIGTVVENVGVVINILLAKGMRSGSLKAGVEQRKQQHLESSPAPVSQKSASFRWFHCFSCCSWGCSFNRCCSCQKIKCCC